VLIRSYRDLRVWQNGLDLVVETYRMTASLPRDELFGLTSQMRRAATSVVANIAEGWGIGYRRDYARRVSIARGSVTELEALVLTSLRLGFAPESSASVCLQMINEESRMLWTLRERLRA
jgi:four helix bundle protein